MLDTRADFGYDVSMAEIKRVCVLDNRAGLINTRCISAKITRLKVDQSGCI